MKKLIVLISVLLSFSATTVFAEIRGINFKPTESEKEFDVFYSYNTNYMDIIEVKNNESVDVTQAFRIRDIPGANYKAEVRYSLFTDTGTSPDMAIAEFGMFAMTCIMNATGLDMDNIPGTTYNVDEIQSVFNCDSGFTTTILPDIKTDFCKDYKYVKIDFFFKRGQGIVMRTFLADDLEFWGVNETGKKYTMNCPYNYFFDYFEFMDKDKNGNFVRRQKSQ